MAFPFRDLPDELAIMIFHRMDNTTLRKLKKISQLSYYFNEIDTLLDKHKTKQVAYHLFYCNYHIYNFIRQQINDEKKLIHLHNSFTPVPEIETSIYLNELLVKNIIKYQHIEKILLVYKCFAKSFENRYVSLFRKVILNEDIKQEIIEYINDGISDIAE
jgi:hypothetical protein